MQAAGSFPVTTPPAPNDRLPSPDANSVVADSQAGGVPAPLPTVAAAASLGVPGPEGSHAVADVIARGHETVAALDRSAAAPSPAPAAPASASDEGRGPTARSEGGAEGAPEDGSLTDARPRAGSLPPVMNMGGGEVALAETLARLRAAPGGGVDDAKARADGSAASDNGAAGVAGPVGQPGLVTTDPLEQEGDDGDVAFGSAADEMFDADVEPLEARPVRHASGVEVAGNVVVSGLNLAAAAAAATAVYHAKQCANSEGHHMAHATRAMYAASAALVFASAAFVANTARTGWSVLSWWGGRDASEPGSGEAGSAGSAQEDGFRMVRAETNPFYSDAEAGAAAGGGDDVEMAISAAAPSSSSTAETL